MRKIISILSVTGLLLALSAGQAKATCTQLTNFQIPQVPVTLNGEFCNSTTYDFFSFVGTGTYNGQVNNVVAVANVTKGKNKVTVSGSITISGPSLNKSITFNKTVPIDSNLGDLTGLVEWAKKLAEQFPH